MENIGIFTRSVRFLNSYYSLEIIAWGILSAVETEVWYIMYMSISIQVNYIKAGNRSIANKGNDKSTESAGRRKEHIAQMDG